MYIIIHSKYFSILDWVKHVTSYYVLLTTFGWILQYVKNDLNWAAQSPENWTVNWEDLGMRSSWKKRNYWLKRSQEQQEDNLTNDISHLKNISRNEQPFIS